MERAENQSPREHIQSLFDSTAHAGRNSTTLANALAKDIETGFDGEQKYILELLQNADDAGLSGQAVNVHFRVVGDYLIVSHNGQHFSATDVEKICDYAQQTYTDKSSDSEKTGYKGIGFKAIFSISDYVAIFSGGYTFRFDKNYFGDNASRSPWPIIPIWTESSELDPGIQSYINPDRVNFIVKLNRAALKPIQEDLATLAKTPRIILFLRHVRKITITIDRARQREIEMQVGEGRIKTLIVDGVVDSRWYVLGVEVEVSEDIRKELATLSSRVCPQKLKEAQHTRLRFAAKINEKGELLPSTESPLYTYLPTRTYYRLPFIVNADFSLNPERTALHNNPWNAFLLKQIGSSLIGCLSELAKKSEFREQILALMSPAILESPEIMDTFKQSYANGIREGINQYAFLPSDSNPDNLLKISECRVDEINFFSNFPEIEVKKFPIEKIVLSKLKNANVLKDCLGFNSRNQLFDIGEFKSILSEIAKLFPSVEFNRRLLNFVIDLTKAYPNFAKDVENTPWLLSEKGKILAPAKLHLCDRSSDQAPEGLDIHYVHPDLLAIPSGQEALKKLGVKTLAPQDLLDSIVEALRNKPDTTPTQAIQFLQFIFDYYRNQGEKSYGLNFGAFKNIKIVTKANNLKFPRDCYLSDKYRSENSTKIETYFSSYDDQFISELYCREKDRPEAWANFFQKIGIIDVFSIQNYNHLSCQSAREILGKHFEEYCRHYSIYSSSPQCESFSNILIVPIIPFIIEMPSLIPLFWDMLQKKWSTIQETEKAYYNYSYRSNRHNEQKKASFLAYQISRLNQTKWILATDGQNYSAKDLYTPKLSKLLSRWFPMPIIPISPDDLMIELLGFKPKLSLEDSIKLLCELTNDAQLNEIIKIHSLIFNQILDALSGKEKNFFNLVGDRIILLLNDGNQLRPIQELSYFSIDEFTPDKSNVLKNYPDFDQKKMFSICKFLKIPVITVETSVSFENPILNSEPKDIFSRFLPLISLHETKKNGDNSAEKLKDLISHLDSLQIYRVESLGYTLEGKINPINHSLDAKNKKLYFTNYSTRSRRDNLHKKIGEYLKLSDKVMLKLGDIFNLPENEIEPWIEENGLQWSEYQKLLLQPEGVTQEDEEEKKEDDPEEIVENLLTEFQGLKVSPGAHFNTPLSPTRITNPFEDPFDPSVQASDINYQNVRVIQRDFISPDTGLSTPIRSMTGPIPTSSSSSLLPVPMTPMPSPQPVVIQSPQSPELGRNLIQIGRWGEEFTYRFLMDHYRRKYPKYSFSGGEDSVFVITDSSGGALKVTWCNQSGESYSPCDILVERTNFGFNCKTDTRYIEVKTTKSNSSEIIISHNEWSLMMQHGNRYRFFRVYNAGQTSAEISKVKDPAAKVASGALIPKGSISLMLG